MAYTGITQRADVATLTSDLSQDYSVLGTSQVIQGAYPDNQSNAGLKSSLGITLNYAANFTHSAYCLQTVGFGDVYSVNNNDNVLTQGYCSDGTIEAGDGG